MDGKTVIITGASRGIGFEAAKKLAHKGARVVLACRDMKTGKKAKDKIIKSTENHDVVVKKLDISSLKSIRKFAEDVLRNEQRLDVLIHNAGTAEITLQKTEDDLELTMATNYFGPFLLTHLLIDLLKYSAPSRIVVVASEFYRLSSLKLENLNPIRSWFPPYLYYVSKTAIICFTLELARRLEGTNVTANCLHPGIIETGIWKNIPAPWKWPVMLLVKAFCKTPQEGSMTTVYLASSEEVKKVTGKYFMDCAERTLTSYVRDPVKVRRLWEVSKQYVRLRVTDPEI